MLQEQMKKESIKMILLFFLITNVVTNSFLLN